MRGSFLAFMLGWALLGLGALLLLFAGVAALLGEPWLPFAVSGLLSLSPGLPLLRLGDPAHEPSRRASLLAVLLLWLLFPLFGSLPFLLGGELGPLDAFFEGMSGFSTTGATVLRDVSAVPGSLLLYRSLSQWLGGIGMLIVFVAVFPQLGVAGRQLFVGEEPGPREDRLSPRLRFASTALLSIYVSLTALCFLSYWLAGMDLLPALSYAFVTLSAGGFSSLPPEAGLFGQPVFMLVAVLFMLLAGTNFTVQYRAFHGRMGDLFRDVEFRAYLAVLGTGSLLLFFLLEGRETVLAAVFQVVSTVTTTGFTAEGMAAWPASAQLLAMSLMFAGGSAGSAAGGIRIMRWLIVLRSTGREVERLLHPRAALPLKVGPRLITPEVLRSVTAFFTLYVLLVAVSTVLLTVSGLDPLTAASAALSSVGLVGYGFTSAGTFLDFASLPAAAKGILIFDMYAGRLEIVTLAVLFVPGFWRLPRRRSRAG